MLILHAPNVHGGGGLTLLRAIVEAVPARVPTLVLTDGRLQLPHLASNVTRLTFPPTVRGRLAAERRLSRLATADDAVLCFGNLPPLLACKGRVTVYLQNRLLCDGSSLGGLPAMVRWRVRAERLWLRRRVRPDMRLMVQTRSMRDCVARALRLEAEVRPFAPVDGVDVREPRTGPAAVPRFVYPASGEPHKNHAVLVEAWRLLQRDGIDAELHLTVDGRFATAALLARAAADGLRVVNHGTLPPDALHDLYRLADAVVFPSTTESFGLPLVEAMSLRLPIVASERDFVRDVSTPAETFDPDSPVSLARAIRRFLGCADAPPRVLAPAEFIGVLLERDGTLP